MKNDTKLAYDVPRTTVIHLAAEQLVCASGQINDMTTEQDLFFEAI